MLFKLLIVKVCGFAVPQAILVEDGVIEKLAGGGVSVISIFWIKVNETTLGLFTPSAGAPDTKR